MKRLEKITTTVASLDAVLDELGNRVRRGDRDEVLDKVCDGIADDIDIDRSIVVPDRLEPWKDSYLAGVRARIGGDGSEKPLSITERPKS